MCRAISKIVLVIVNLVFALLSLVLLAIGIWVAVASRQTAAIVDGTPQYNHSAMFTGSTSLMSSAILCIVVGSVGALLSISGCAGALKESTMLLTLYSVILGLLVIAELVVLGLVAVYSSEIGKQIAIEMFKIEQQQFMPFNQLKQKEPMNNSDIMSHAINRMQLELKCCGVNNYTDITQRNTSWSKANPQYKAQSMKVPVSCCKFTDEGVTELAKTTNWTGFSNYLVKGSQCPTTLADFHDQGCFPVIKEAAKAGVVSVLVVSAIFAAFNIACIIMACCLIRNYKSRDAF